jgi:predicted HTH transcriptional regulator
MVDIDFDNLPAEGKTIDYKRDLSSHKKIVEDAIAFANSAGGKIIIGITDDYEIVGVKDPLLEEERICNILSDSIAPRLLPDVEMVTHNGKTLLILEIFPSSLKPHYVINKGSDDGVVVRVGSTNRKADANLIAELRRTALGGTFDEMPILELLEDEIDADAIREAFGGERKITKRELLSLKLLVNEQGKTVPTKGGIILFGKSRGKYFPDAKVMCGRFRGLDKLDIFDQVVIDTYLPFAIDEIEAFLKKHAYKGAEIEGMRRKDVWSIPLEILREVVINGLVHR